MRTRNFMDVIRKEKAVAEMEAALEAGWKEFFIGKSPSLINVIGRKAMTRMLEYTWKHGFASGAEFEADRQESSR